MIQQVQQPGTQKMTPEGISMVITKTWMKTAQSNKLQLQGAYVNLIQKLRNARVLQDHDDLDHSWTS